MKAILLSFLACTLCLASCSVFKRSEPLTYTARGCHPDSLKKQSAIIFQRNIRRSGYQKEQVFVHQVYEKDSVIIIQWFPVINENTWGNGIVVKISKKDCRVLEEIAYQ